MTILSTHWCMCIAFWRSIRSLIRTYSVICDPTLKMHTPKTQTHTHTERQTDKRHIQKCIATYVVAFRPSMHTSIPPSIHPSMIAVMCCHTRYCYLRLRDAMIKKQKQRCNKFLSSCCTSLLPPPPQAITAKACWLAWIFCTPFS